MVDDISKLYAKILEEQNEKDSKASIVENHLIEENESQISDSFPKEEPFDNFLLKLSEKIAEHLDISEDVEDNQNEEVDDSENNYDGIPLEKQTTKSSYIEELQKIDKGDKSKLISKNDNISATISEQVKEEIGKVKTQISRMAIEGGGGSVAVQYAKGGVMNGDLNVTGKYLSGGIDLSTLIGSGGSGGGGLSGTTDRLVSGSEVFKLNTDGTFNFPNNIITPQDEVILTLEATKVLDGYYNRLALSPHGFFASDHNGNSITIDSTDNEILIDSNNTYFWKFNNQGALEGPFGTLSVSGNLSATGRVYQNGNDLQTEIENISSFATSTKTTIQSNSASWDYQGSDIKALTGNWQEAYTNLVTNSAAYLSSVDLSFLSVSTNWDSVYTTVLNESASWIGGGGLTGEYLPLSGGVMTGPISFSYPYGSKLDQGIYDSSRGGLSGISLVCSVNYDFNWQAGWITALEQDRLTPRPLYIDSGAGTSLRVWDGRNYPTSGIEISHSQITFADNTTQITAFTGNTLTFDESTKDLSISNGNTVSLSALVDISSIDTGVRLLTSNWESTYTTVYSNSANWQGLYTTVQTNSSTWVNGISAQVILARVFNADSVTMNKGDVVYTFGATGDVMSVKLASNVSEATSSKTLGFVNETISTGGIGYVVIAGQIDKMSFPDPFQEGDALWLGETAGTFTRVKPTAPNHNVYLGVVERANNGNGLAYVKVQNGYELDEIHDVLINGIQAGDLLQRNSTNTLWINGPLSADGSNITSGTIDAARMPTFNGDITATTTNGSVSARVVAIQGEPVSTQVPVDGQVLQWNGTAWTPGSLPQGGSGGGGVSYFLNQALSAEEPTTNLPLTAHQLGKSGVLTQTIYTTPNISQVAYVPIVGFVTDALDPNITSIPGGIWDLNIWGFSNASLVNPTLIRAKIYIYDGTNPPILLSTSDNTTLTDSGLFVQHQMSCLVPQTSASLTDRIYVEIEAIASAGLKTVTLGFGNSTPSHIHTTIPSVGGSGLVKVIDGVTQSPASLLVDADVASNANIAQSKINGLPDLSSQSSSTYTTVNSNSADWNSVYSSVQTNSATWNAGSVGPYQATYYKSANQNLTNGSTDITFDQYATWNNDNGYITHTSGSSNFTVVQAGVYQLEWNASINANGASWNNALNKTISINITRSPELEQLVIGQSALMAIGQNYSQSICSTIKLEVGDVINLQTFLAFSITTPFVQGVLNTYDLNTWFYWRFISQ